MASKYQKQHYEDVAKLLKAHHSGQPADPMGSALFRGRYRPPFVRVTVGYIAQDFADLFAADNPRLCLGCGKRDPHKGKAWPEQPGHNHSFAGGFDRERFFKACGLES